MKTGRAKWFITMGLMIGFCLQLHYVTVLLIFPMGLEAILTSVHLLRLKQHRATLTRNLSNIFLAVTSGVVTFIPLILFDIKNHFINFQTLLRASSTGEIQAKNIAYIDRFNDVMRSMWHHTLGVDWSTESSLIALVGLILLAYFIVRAQYQDVRRRFMYGCVILITSFIPLFALLETGRHVHYYNHLYLASYLLISFILSYVVNLLIKWITNVGISRETTSLIVYIAMGLFLLIYLRSHISMLVYLKEPTRPYTQMGDAQTVARYIIDQHPAEAYQVVGLPFYETEGHYRYYLEYFNKKPMPADALGDPAELYVTCHEDTIKACQIAGNPQWQLADFQNRHPRWRKVSEKKVTNVWVVKIVQ
jgi:hypothetical protein